ncbi:hypothetical protein B0H17DRAFT_1123809 [Mycena rosella]|uniref:Uncharacterized protein n=1 Tax=Mycena rosella TaxID=1033263 RepID=A0AAD7MCQ2_MYCRO|nr:hypothetical protein B0H17DRAFT_1123809 [Mycena rosella]
MSRFYPTFYPSLQRELIPTDSTSSLGLPRRPKYSYSQHAAAFLAVPGPIRCNKNLALRAIYSMPDRPEADLLYWAAQAGSLDQKIRIHGSGYSEGGELPAQERLLNTYLPNGGTSIEDFDYDSMSFVLASMKRVSGTTPELTNELKVFASKIC